MEKHEESMGIKFSKTITFALVLAMLMSRCSQKEIASNKLCDEFYQLNKSRDFEGLFDVNIGSGRVMNVYDESANRYDLIFNTIAVFDTVSNEYFILPVFKKGASQVQKDSAFNKVPSESRSFLIRKLGTTSEELFDNYVLYVNKVYDKYYSIKAPKSYSGKNVPLQGNPSLGKFIKFTLNDKVNIYYVADASTLNDYWSKRFNSVHRLDEDWFCEITESPKTD